MLLDLTKDWRTDYELIEIPNPRKKSPKKKEGEPERLPQVQSAIIITTDSLNCSKYPIAVAVDIRSNNIQSIPPINENIEASDYDEDEELEEEDDDVAYVKFFNEEGKCSDSYFYWQLRVTKPITYRPFNNDEMKALVGKTIERKDGSVTALVINYREGQINAGVDHVNNYITAQDLQEFWLIGGKECQVVDLS